VTSYYERFTLHESSKDSRIEAAGLSEIHRETNEQQRKKAKW